MMRIYATWLQNFNLFKHNPIPNFDYTQDRLIEDLTGEREATRVMNLGAAIHKVLEGAVKVRPPQTVVVDGFRFNPYDCNDMLKHVDAATFNEVKTVTPYQTNYGTVNIVSKVDGIKGLDVYEHKTKWGRFDLDQYASSMQWRCYLDGFGCNAVHYNVFCMNDLEGKSDSLDAELKEHHRFSFYRYEGMHEDIMAMLNDFMGFVSLNNLHHILQPRVQVSQYDF